MSRSHRVVQLGAIVVALVMGGCSRYGYGPGRSTMARMSSPPPVVIEQPPSPPAAPPVDPSHVLVLQGSADRPSEVLGLVDVHGRMGEEDQALGRLRERAAQMGADAVLYVEFHHGGEHHHEHGEEEDSDGATDESAAEADPMALHLSGEAVRFRDLIGGREYRVISELEVEAPMGDEAQGLAELQRQAAALHADLVVGVRFEHGSGEGSLHVEGSAVRFVR